jgi:hypothetical protein
MSPVLEQLRKELETYAAHKAELLGSAEGRYALVHGDEVAGTWETEQDAIAEGYRRYGNVPFLVKQIVDVEVPETFVSNHFASS